MQAKTLAQYDCRYLATLTLPHPHPHSAGAFSVSRATRPSSSLKMSAKDMAGVTAPLGFFDPLGFATKADAKTLSKYRESELKHGRVAMLAVLGYLGAERWHPLYDGKLSGNGLEALSQVPTLGWVQIVGFCAIIEYTQWNAAKSPTYKAGDLYGFNSLFADEKDPSWVDFQNRELNNGRAAMFGILGEIVHSKITGKGAIELLASEPLHSQFLNGHAQCVDLFCGARPF